MTVDDPRLIESHVRLRDSKLWQIQRNYYQSMGITAWKEEVPFYISSNAFVAKRYAQLVLNIIRDFKRHHPTANDEVFYITEIGSGTGKFAFYFLIELEVLLEEYQLKDVRFCYIISDLIENNIKFCQENPCFARFVSQGVLDFARFNVETDADFHLILKNKAYSTLKNKTPLIIIANYTFDCTTQDAFTIKEGKTECITLQLRSRYKNFNIEKSLHLDDLRLNYKSSPIDYDQISADPHIQQIIQDYQHHFKERNAEILMPLGAITFFNQMKTLTQSNYVAIVGDKGLSSLDEISLLSDQYYATYDGSYAFLVNFHALANYIKQTSGDALLTRHSNDFKVNLYSQGLSFDQMTQTKAIFEQNLECTGPDEYCFIYDENLTSSYRFTLRGVMSFLRFSNWDPDAYSAIHDRLIELIPSAIDQMKGDILNDLEKVRNKVYRMNIGEDVYNLLGILFRTQNQDEKALELFLQSIDVFGNRAAAHNNAAVIYEKMNNIPKALFHYQKSYELDKNNRFAKNKIYVLSGRSYMTLIAPILKGIVIVILIGIILYFINR